VVNSKKISFSDKYQEEISKLRAKILTDYNNGVRAKNVFLETIKSVVGV